MNEDMSLLLTIGIMVGGTLVLNFVVSGFVGWKSRSDRQDGEVTHSGQCSSCVSLTREVNWDDEIPFAEGNVLKDSGYTTYQVSCKTQSLSPFAHAITTVSYQSNPYLFTDS